MLLATFPSGYTMNGSRLLIRDVPASVRDWIQDQCERRKVTQQTLLLTLLREASGDGSQLGLFDDARAAPPVTAVESGISFTFIDLFAGIGGLRLGLEAAGGRCTFSSEWDPYSQRTYQAWFGESPHGDITRPETQEAIPRKFDLLAAGFPCQPFSLAGVSKKNSLGRAHGFNDKLQGNLFFTLATIIESHRPAVILLENVKNLRSHDQGRTWKVIESRLRELDYTLFVQIVDAAGWVPQHRERIFIVGFDRRLFRTAPDFHFPVPPREKPPRLDTILDPDPDPKYTLSDHLWKYLKSYADRHRERGNGFGYGLAKLDGVTRTLSARYYKDGSEILVPQPGRNPRRLTPREAARLMGFPDHLPVVVSDTQAYRQFGNAVVPPVAEAVARQIVQVFSSYLVNVQGGVFVRAGSGSRSTVGRLPRPAHA